MAPAAAFVVPPPPPPTATTATAATTTAAAAAATQWRWRRLPPPLLAAGGGRGWLQGGPHPPPLVLAHPRVTRGRPALAGGRGLYVAASATGAGEPHLPVTVAVPDAAATRPAASAAATSTTAAAVTPAAAPTTGVPGMASDGDGTPSPAVAATADADADDGDRFAGATYAGRLPPWLVTRMGELGWVTPTAVQRRALDVLLPPASATATTAAANDGRDNGRDEAAADNGGGRGGGRGGRRGRRGGRGGPRRRVNDGEAGAGGGTTRLGTDAVVHAVTGSGKTLAYLLPALAAVEPRRTAVQALVVVPTQELGMQVYKVARRLASGYGREVMAAAETIDGANDEASLLDYLEGGGGAPKGVAPESGGTADTTAAATAPAEAAGAATRSRPPLPPPAAGRLPVLPMLDQADLRRQKLQLRQTAPRLVIGTPGRLVALVASGRLCLDRLKVLVVDEFDAVLSDPALTAHLQALLATKSRAGGIDRDGGVRQTVLVSATVPQHRHFLRQAVRNRWTRPVVKHVWVGGPDGEDAASREGEPGDGDAVGDDDDDDAGEGKLPSSLRHTYALCEPRKRLGALRQLLVQDLLVDPPRPTDGGASHTDDVASAAAAAAASGGAAARNGGGGRGGEVEHNGSATPSPPLPGVIVFVMPSRPVDAIVAALNGALPPCASPPAPPMAAVAAVTAAGASSTSANTPALDDGATACSPPSSTPPAQPLVVGLSAASSLHSRRRALAAFRAGTARVLVATDVAARGLDIPHTAAVVHFDLPPDATAYVHRSGRAGRAGRAGVVVSLVAPGEAFVMDRWANVLGLNLERWGPPPPAATSGVGSSSAAGADSRESGEETVGMEG